MGSVERPARRGVVLADAVPVRGAAADSVVEGVDSGGAGAGMGRG